MKIAIVGGGKKVDFLVESLLDKHHNLTVINCDRNECIELSRAHENINVIHGDGSKSFILEDAAVGDADLMIAITSNDADNLVICQLAKKRFGIKRAFATVSDPANQFVFKRLGINTAISATRVMAEIIGQMASVHEIVNYIPMENGKLQLMEFHIASDNALCGKKLAEISLPKNSAVGFITHDGEVAVPSSDTKISAGDTLTVMAITEEKTEVVNIFTGGIG